MKTTLAICALCLFFPLPVLAQPSASPPLPTERHGLFAGGSLTGGDISCDGVDCGGFREAGGGALQVGYMLTPRFGVLLDAWAMTSEQNDVALTFVTTTINARYWLANTIWIQGGVGNGHARAAWGPFMTNSDDVPVAQLAAGIELIRGPRWALDLHAKVAQGSSTDDDGDSVTTGRAAGLGVSFTYYAMR